MENDVIFLSYFLDASTPAYGGREHMVQVKQVNAIADGSTSNNSLVSLPVHIGTHIDFPYHFSNSGKKSGDYPASFWIFNKVALIECSMAELETYLDHIENDIELLMIKTGFGVNRQQRKYWAEQPVIPSRYGSILRQKFPQLRVFGFDMISMTSKLDRPEGKLAHQQFLLENDILVLEDMDLRFLIKRPRKVIISPLQISDTDGAPCTVIAFL